MTTEIFTASKIAALYGVPKHRVRYAFELLERRLGESFRPVIPGHDRVFTEDQMGLIGAELARIATARKKNTAIATATA